MFYLPRENWDETDHFYGENVNSRFEKAYKIDVYIMPTKQFDGNQDFFSKFGLEIRDNASFTVARRTFERYIPTNITRRPREGDLLWVPVMNRIFEIKFVEEETQMFSLGNRNPYTYEMKCELFRYSNEQINTGIETIDNVDTSTSYTVKIMLNYGPGNYNIGELVYQGQSTSNNTMLATVSDWDLANSNLYIVNMSGSVVSTQNIIGAWSNTSRSISATDALGDHTYYDSSDNKQIQDEANTFIDLSESNVFGMP